jgi:hypothetical protein
LGGGQNKYRDFSNVIFFIDARRDTVNIFRILCIQCVGGCKPIVSVLACIESWQATRAGWRRIRGKYFSLRRRQRPDEGRLGASTESSMIKALEVIFLSTWNRVWLIIKGGKRVLFLCKSWMRANTFTVFYGPAVTGWCPSFRIYFIYFYLFTLNRKISVRHRAVLLLGFCSWWTFELIAF